MKCDDQSKDDAKKLCGFPSNNLNLHFLLYSIRVVFLHVIEGSTIYFNFFTYLMHNVTCTHRNIYN